MIGVISNPVRWQSRYRLARKWIEEMEKTPNVRAYVVEAAYGDREHEVTEPSCDRHMQVRIKSEIWLKENLINIGVKNLLPKDWKYMAWVDMDVHFRDPNWATSTVHQLQHYNLVQPWSHCADLDFHGGVHQSFKSFGYLHSQGKQKWHGKGKDGYEYAHTGFAWACTRYFYENVEKILDFCIFGSGDHHMAWACIGLVRETIHGEVTQGYLDLCLEWQAKAMRATAKLIGFTHGRIEHNFHGPKERRQYWSRWQIPLTHNYDPRHDIAYDSQGVIQFVGSKKYEFERDIMQYNRQRLEDSVEQY